MKERLNDWIDDNLFPLAFFVPLAAMGLSFVVAAFMQHVDSGMMWIPMASFMLWACSIVVIDLCWARD